MPAMVVRPREKELYPVEVLLKLLLLTVTPLYLVLARPKPNSMPKYKWRAT